MQIIHKTGKKGAGPDQATYSFPSAGKSHSPTFGYVMAEKFEIPDV